MGCGNSNETLDIKEKPSEERIAAIEKALGKYIENEDYLELHSISLAQDKLALDSNRKIRKFNDISGKVEILVDFDKVPIEGKENMTVGEKDRVFNEFIGEKNSDLIEKSSAEIREDWAHLDKIVFVYRDEKNKMETEIDHGFLKNENLARDLAYYNYKSEEGVLEDLFALVDIEEYQLTRFGIENGKLVGEIEVLYPDKDEAMEKLAQDIEETILKNEDYMKDVKKENIEDLQLVFKLGGQDKVLANYDYKLK